MPHIITLVYILLGSGGQVDLVSEALPVAPRSNWPVSFVPPSRPRAEQQLESLKYPNMEYLWLLY